MANWIKRLNKVATNDLHPGETFVAGIVLLRKGTTKRTALGGGLGGVVGVVVASKLKNNDDGPLVSDSGIATRLPEGPIVVGVTAARVLIYEQASLSAKPKNLQLALERTDLTAVDVGDGKLARDVTLAFADGTRRLYETPGMDKSIEAFAAQFA